LAEIRLGATATPGLYLLPALLATYRGDYPTYDLRLEIGPSHVIAERVARNDLDMAIVAGPLPSGELQARSLSRDELVIIVPPNSPLAGARPLKPNQLQSETLHEPGIAAAP
jgi:DNA-binding transcriptional LysR family regulator